MGDDVRGELGYGKQPRGVGSAERFIFRIRIGFLYSGLRTYYAGLVQGQLRRVQGRHGWRRTASQNTPDRILSSLMRRQAQAARFEDRT